MENENPGRRISFALACQLVGWFLFIVCSICYLASAVAHRDTLTILGSVIFLIACIVFLIPLVAQLKKPMR